MQDEKKRVTISIDEKLHEQGKQLARADRRDFSAWIETTIEERWKTLEEKRETQQPQEAAA